MSPSLFSEHYRCYSVTALRRGREQTHVINYGGKIILPPSALESLVNRQVSNPMLFSVTNPKTGKKTHGGVLEFVAEEGRVYLPDWVIYSWEESMCLFRFMTSWISLDDQSIGCGGGGDIENRERHACQGYIYQNSTMLAWFFGHYWSKSSVRNNCDPSVLSIVLSSYHMTRATDIKMEHGTMGGAMHVSPCQPLPHDPFYSACSLALKMHYVISLPWHKGTRLLFITMRSNTIYCCWRHIPIQSRSAFMRQIWRWHAFAVTVNFVLMVCSCCIF